MLRNTVCRALRLQLNRPTCQSIKPRMTLPLIKPNRFHCQKYVQHSIRSFATLPSSTVIKPASTENGIDISEKAVKVNINK